MEVESRITGVTLYARGARVRRITALAAAAPRVRVVGLPAAVIDDTVRAWAEGGAVVTAVHVGLAAPDAEAAAGEESPEVAAARRRAALADAEVERLTAALAILGAAPIAPAEPLAPGTSDEPLPAWDAIVEARRALVALRAERELALREQLAAVRRAAEDAHRALTAALDRDRRTGSARAARLHELRKHVDLELEIDGAGSATVHLEYQVEAARWAPSYVARMAGEQVILELRAVIAQATGEDWTAVAVRLSTAEPERFGALPELAAQRIGRRQPEPAHPGFRAPPSGAGALYADYLRSFPEPPRRTDRAGAGEQASPILAVDPTAAGELSSEVWDEESSRAKQAFSMPPPGAPPPPGAMSYGGPPPAIPAQPGLPARTARTMFAAPLPVATMMASAAARGMIAGAAGGGAAQSEARRSEPPPPATPVPAPPPRLDYGNLRMAPPGARDRGTLVPAPRDPRIAALEGEILVSVARIGALALPPGCRADWPHTYDYAYATDGAVDVRSDGTWHSIAVTAQPTEAILRHVAVPRVQPDAFRIAAIANPLAGPLLPGPIDVYDRGRFLVTSSVEHTPPGARVEIGLGVDPEVKLARNTEFREETTGVLRGGLRLHHAIAIDVDNLSDRAIDLEVRERLPVTRDDDDEIDMVVGRVEPAWERWTPDPEGPGERRLRGGYRWRLEIPARTTRILRAAYEIKIAGKLELVGGNRRES